MSGERFVEFATQVREGRQPTATVRELLSWHGASRRGYWVNLGIKQALQAVGLKTEPDFESAYIDSLVTFLPLEPSAQSEGVAESEVISELPVEAVIESAHVTAYADPTYRISKLAAANISPITVKPDATVGEAVTLMMDNDFSQLPVMTSDREVKGVISWTSIGSRFALGKTCHAVREAMDPHVEIRTDASLFATLNMIADHGYVLIRAMDGRITGILTSSDLAEQFRQLAEPFLLLSEVENHIRRIVEGKFTVEELSSARDSSDPSRVVKSVADLTFGEYLRLLENPERWDKLKLPIDRKVFVVKLDRLRRIRNDVMHFDPDGIPEADLDALRDSAKFLQRLQAIGVT
jgi:predicted transcriptional regulator